MASRQSNITYYDLMGCLEDVASCKCELKIPDSPHNFSSTRCIHVTHKENAKKIKFHSKYYMWIPRKKHLGFGTDFEDAADDMFLVWFSFVPHDKAKVVEKTFHQVSSHGYQLIEGYSSESRYGSVGFAMDLQHLLKAYLYSLNYRGNGSYYDDDDDEYDENDLVTILMKMDEFHSAEVPNVLLVKPRGEAFVGGKNVTDKFNPVAAIQGKPWKFDINSIYSFIPKYGFRTYDTWELALQFPRHSRLSILSRGIHEIKIRHDPESCIPAHREGECPDQ